MASSRAQDTLISIVNDLRLSKITSVSAITALFYDVLLTSDEEWRLIWSKGRMLSSGKILFLAIRYYSIASAVINLWVTFNTHPTERLIFTALKTNNPAIIYRCHIWFQWQAVSTLLIFAMTEVALILRIWALYGQSKKIIVFTVSLFIACIGTGAGLVYLDIHNANAIPASLIPGSSFCVPFSSWNKYWATWIPIIVLETALFALALFKGYQYLLRRLRLGWSDNSILDILIRDSIVYYFVIFVTHVATLTIWSANLELLEVPAPFAVVMPVIMSSRLMLNIRKTHYNATTIHTISDFSAYNPAVIRTGSSSDPESSYTD